MLRDFWAVMAICVGITSVAQAAPEITVSPLAATNTEPSRITIEGLEPWARATVVLTTTLRGKPFVAQADYQANARGDVVVHEQAPLSGSYSGVDPYGLFWSMKPAEPTQHDATDDGGETEGEPNEPASVYDPAKFPELAEYTVTVLVSEESVASTMFHRRLLRKDVRGIRIEEGRLRGVLWLPPGDGPHPTFLVVSGSGGGYPNSNAWQLANRGYAAFSLAYFAAPDLPEQLSEIPLEYFVEGIDWLLSQPTTDTDRLGVMGGSRGGELSLLLAPIEPRINMVVSWVPSHVVWGACCDPSVNGKASWTLNGAPVPSVGDSKVARYSPWYWPESSTTLGYFWLSLANEQATEGAMIPIEQSGAPILLISGGKDELWPSAYMADQVVERLEASKYPYPYAHVLFDEAGHALGRAPDVPVDLLIEVVHPVTGDSMRLGGTREGMAAASLEAWRIVEQFLDAHW